MSRSLKLCLTVIGLAVIITLIWKSDLTPDYHNRTVILYVIGLPGEDLISALEGTSENGVRVYMAGAQKIDVGVTFGWKNVPMGNFKVWMHTSKCNVGQDFYEFKILKKVKIVTLYFDNQKCKFVNSSPIFE